MKTQHKHRAKDRGGDIYFGYRPPNDLEPAWLTLQKDLKELNVPMSRLWSALTPLLKAAIENHVEMDAEGNYQVQMNFGNVTLKPTN